MAETKATAKKSTTKKASANKSTSSRASKELKVGSDVLTRVDPRQNGGSDVAAAKVTKSGKETVNLTVFLDGEENQWVRDVTVVKSEPKKGEDSAKRVCWPA